MSRKLEKVKKIILISLVAATGSTLSLITGAKYGKIETTWELIWGFPFWLLTFGIIYFEFLGSIINFFEEKNNQEYFEAEVEFK